MDEGIRPLKMLELFTAQAFRIETVSLGLLVNRATYLLDPHLVI